MTNKPRGALYVGVTANRDARVWRHRNGDGGSEFRKRYNLVRLVHAEQHATIEQAIAREKALKTWQRKWRIELIQSANPEWRDPGDEIAPIS